MPSILFLDLVLPGIIHVFHVYIYCISRIIYQVYIFRKQNNNI